MQPLTTTWRLPAAPATVWDTIARVEQWPRWWPGMASTAVVRPGGPGGLGQRTLIEVRSPLGYRLAFGVEIVFSAPPLLSRAVVVGDLAGTGEWSVEPVAEGCVATIRWDVAPTSEPLRTLVRVAPRPAIWAHGRVMSAGERGLVREIADDGGSRAGFGER